MKTIAVVEDNKDNMLLVRMMLNPHYRLKEYSSGRAALHGISSKPPDLVLLDISLPDLSGTTVMQKLRDQHGLTDLPICALTAHAMRGDRERFLEAGFDFYMEKPVVDIEQFLRDIGGFLRARTEPAPRA